MRYNVNRNQGQVLSLLFASIFDNLYCLRHTIFQRNEIAKERRIDHAPSTPTGSGPLYPDPVRKSERKERLT